MKRHIIIIFFLTLPIIVQSENNGQAKIDMSKISIHKQPNTNWPFKDARNSKLNKTELTLVESILSHCIADYNKEHNSSINLSEYKRQYVVVINKLGEKEIWINCLCHTNNLKWRKEIITTGDGGSCYFNLRINLSKRTCYQFIVNGIA